jgi:hypothetical protein
MDPSLFTTRTSDTTPWDAITSAPSPSTYKLSLSTAGAGHAGTVLVIGLPVTTRSSVGDSQPPVPPAPPPDARLLLLPLLSVERPPRPLYCCCCCCCDVKDALGRDRRRGRGRLDRDISLVVGSVGTSSSSSTVLLAASACSTDVVTMVGVINAEFASRRPRTLTHATTHDRARASDSLRTFTDAPASGRYEDHHEAAGDCEHIEAAVCTVPHTAVARGTAPQDLGWAVSRSVAPEELEPCRPLVRLCFSVRNLRTVMRFKVVSPF